LRIGIFDSDTDSDPKVCRFLLLFSKQSLMRVAHTLRRMKMNGWGVPMRGLKPAATTHKIMLQDFAALCSLSNGGGLQPALPRSIFEASV
jgi:hypothetical protein